VTTSAGTPIHPQFRIIDGPPIRFAESEDRHDHALLLRVSDSDRQRVTGLAAACAVGRAGAGASTERDAT
jgi:hypothetical protein